MREARLKKPLAPLRLYQILQLVDINGRNNFIHFDDVFILIFGPCMLSGM